MSSNDVYFDIKEYTVENGQIQQGQVLGYNNIQNVYGTAINTVVKYYGSQIVCKGGIASGTILEWCASQIVNRGGIASGTIIEEGTLVVNQGGIVKNLKIKNSPEILIYDAKAKNINIYGSQVDMSGVNAESIKVTGESTINIANCNIKSINVTNAAARFTGKTYLSGKNIFYRTGGEAPSGIATIKMRSGASLLVTKTDIGYCNLDLRNAKAQFCGNSSLWSLTLNEKSNIVYDITSKYTLMSKINSIRDKNPILYIEGRHNKQNCGLFTVKTSKSQRVGRYWLSTHIYHKTGKAYSIVVGTKKVGVVKLDKNALIKNGMTYTLRKHIYGAQVSLDVGIKAGDMIKGNAKANKLNGAAHSDIFYGGKGNDTITGKNGRDVVVYDKKAWGKDKIVKTGGTMTLLFKNLSKKDIVQKLKGKTMTITRKGSSNQSIIIQGWNKDTHNVVFGETMNAFNKWLKASKPTVAQTTAARNEIWKKAKLA